jgi:hypothetical protein
MLQEVVGQSGSHPAGSFVWVKADGRSIDDWEQGQAASSKTLSNQVSFAPQAELYVVELRGSFRSSPHVYKSIAIALVPTHTTGSPSKEGGVGFTWHTWVASKFKSLSSLGQVHHDSVPLQRRLIKGRVPNLVGLSYSQAQSALHELGSTLKDHNVRHFDSPLPPFTVVAQTPNSGRRQSRGLVQITLNM